MLSSRPRRPGIWLPCWRCRNRRCEGSTHSSRAKGTPAASVAAHQRKNAARSTSPSVAAPSAPLDRSRATWPCASASSSHVDRDALEAGEVERRLQAGHPAAARRRAAAGADRPSARARPATPSDARPATGRTSKRYSPKMSFAQGLAIASRSTCASSSTWSPGAVRVCRHQSAPSGVHAGLDPQVERVVEVALVEPPRAGDGELDRAAARVALRSRWPARTRGRSRPDTAGRGPVRCRRRSSRARARPAAPTRAWCRAAAARPPASACGRRRGAGDGRAARTARRRRPGRRRPARLAAPRRAARRRPRPCRARPPARCRVASAVPVASPCRAATRGRRPGSSPRAPAPAARRPPRLAARRRGAGCRSCWTLSGTATITQAAGASRGCRAGRR